MCFLQHLLCFRQIGHSRLPFLRRRNLGAGLPPNFQSQLVRLPQPSRCHRLHLVQPRLLRCLLLFLGSTLTLRSIAPLCSCLSLAFGALCKSFSTRLGLGPFLLPCFIHALFVPVDRPLVACLPFAHFSWHTTVVALLSPTLVVMVADRAPPVLEPVPFAFFLPAWGAVFLALAFAFLSHICPHCVDTVPVSPTPTTRGYHGPVVPVVAV